MTAIADVFCQSTCSQLDAFVDAHPESSVDELVRAMTGAGVPALGAAFAISRRGDCRRCRTPQGPPHQPANPAHADHCSCDGCW